jgi:hypothetical protein
MSYTREQALEFTVQCDAALKELLLLQARFDTASAQFQDDRIQEYLKYGVGRRCYLIGWALRNVYNSYPPEQTANLGLQGSADVQLNLHAFYINLAGAFDNMAWAFVLRHGLFNPQQIRKRNQVGMLQKTTRKFLPRRILIELQSPESTAWMDTHLTDYRDALAHRIPLYLPQAFRNQQEIARATAIPQEMIAALRDQDFQRIEVLEREQSLLGRPSTFVMHSVRPAEPSRPMYFHPQIVADVRTLIQFGGVFLDHWHEVNLNP